MSQQRGFTLIELMIAVSIFAVISVAAYSGLRQMTRSASALSEQQQNWKELKLLVSSWERDVEQLALPHRDGAVQVQQQPLILKNGQSLSLVRAGQSNPLEQKLSQTQLVQWFYQGKALFRLAHPFARGSQLHQQPQKQMGQVKSILFQVEDQNFQWHSDWPDDEGLNAIALKMQLRFESQGTLERIVELPTLIPFEAGRTATRPPNGRG